MTDPIELFDQFIRDYVDPSLHGHLLDSDDNSGEYVRRAIREVQAFDCRAFMPAREYRVASSLGSQYMFPTYFPSLEEAETFLRRHNAALDGLPGVDTVRIETRPPAGQWQPIDGATS